MALTVSITMSDPTPKDAQALVTMAHVMTSNTNFARVINADADEEDRDNVLDEIFWLWQQDVPDALAELAFQVLCLATALDRAERGGVLGHDDMWEEGGRESWGKCLPKLLRLYQRLLTLLQQPDNEPETTEGEALLERLKTWLLTIDRMYGEDTVPELVLVSDGSGRIVDAQGFTLFEFGCLDALNAHLVSSINEALT